MKKVYIIDEVIDKRGGVQRVVNTLANNLYELYDITVISLKKTCKEPCFEYCDDIKIDYVVNEYKFKSKQCNSKNFKYYFHRIFEKILYEKIHYNNYLVKLCKNLSDDDTLILGRIENTAFDIFKYLKKYKKHPKLIIREPVLLPLYNAKMQNKMLEYFPEFVTTFVVSSDECIAEYNEFFNNKVNIVKIYNPLGIEPKKCGKYDNKKVVSCGRMYDDQKGFSILIKSFKAVNEKYPDWKLEIYGNGIRENEFKKIVSDYNLEHCVSIKDSSKDIIKTFDESAIFVLASRFEGYANILVEALACGMPSITVNWLNGADEIIKDNENGIMVNLKDRRKYFEGVEYTEDINALSDAIIELISNKDEMERFSEEGMKIIDSRNKDTIIGKWKALIDS